MFIETCYWIFVLIPRPTRNQAAHANNDVQESLCAFDLFRFKTNHRHQQLEGLPGGYKQFCQLLGPVMVLILWKTAAWLLQLSFIPITSYNRHQIILIVFRCDHRNCDVHGGSQVLRCIWRYGQGGAPMPATAQSGLGQPPRTLL